MARGKPLTGFLLALVHSRELTAAFNDPEQRQALLEEWGLGEHPLFAGEGDPTLTEVQEAVNAEHEGQEQSGSLFGGGGEAAAPAPTVSIAWWIWF
jgi:hypothetical protein